MKALGGWTDGPLRADLDRVDLVLIANAINEVLHGPDAAEEWEFETRLGATPDEARRLLDEGNGALGQPGSA
jgi:hypothetical protein